MQFSKRVLRELMFGVVLLCSEWINKKVVLEGSVLRCWNCHVTHELTSNITHQKKTKIKDISRNGTRKTIEDKREDDIKDNAILCGHKEQSMQDISRKGTRWTFEDNKEEDIKDGTMHSTQYIQLNGIWSIETTLQWIVVTMNGQ